MTNDHLRNAQLSDLAELLEDQRTRKLDVVVPSTSIRSVEGLWVIDGAVSTLDESGVTTTAGMFRPTQVADEGVAEKLGIPRAYLRTMREGRLDLYDANVNGWLHGSGPRLHKGPDELYHYTASVPDSRRFLVRTFVDPDGGEGIARAFLSGQYRIVDHLDVLTAALEGIRESGVETRIDRVDLTDRRMYVRVHAPAVAALAPELLKDYRSPFTGASGTDNPVVFAGFVISNSETGGGAATLTPEVIVQVCSNGMTIRRDALKAIHLGSKLEPGVVRWSEDTQRKNLELIQAKATDAVRTFLDREYLEAKVRELSKRADEPVNHKGIETITKQLAYTQERTESVLDFFIRGGQPTLGGVAQAITAAAQTEPDADVAAQMQSDGAELLLAA